MAKQKKRLRKKLRKGEFKEFGFHVMCSLSSKLSENKANTFHDTFLAECIEANGLVCGGGMDSEKIDIYVTLMKNGSTTEDHRENVKSWLNSRDEITQIFVATLTDAWNN